MDIDKLDKKHSAWLLNHIIQNDDYTMTDIILDYLNFLDFDKAREESKEIMKELENREIHQLEIIRKHKQLHRHRLKKDMKMNNKRRSQNVPIVDN
tara:strand:- start:603 stop:890 length:288 start_codon:yes stop_codon:yes gene_type:complete